MSNETSAARTTSAHTTAATDALDGHDRVFLEKLRLAATVILDLGEDDGVINNALEAELHIFRDRVDRALLLPESAA